MKVLVAEDDKQSRYLMEKMLQGYGHEVIAVANGAEALEQALAQQPDIIVSDIMMPKMDGFQFCQECKQNEQLKNIPFIFYTATYISDEDEKFALSLGADAFIPKATEPDIFIQKLCEVFEKAKSHPLAPDEVTTLEPSLYLTEYNKRIVAKLEQKMAQIEIEIAERRRAQQELAKHRDHLEELVKKRTAELEKKTIDLEQANIRLKELDRLKSTFLASMSHELRTPLNSIIGFTGIILQGMAGEVNEEQRKQLTMVENSASHLLSLISDVLDISKVEAGKVELSLEEFRLDDIAGEVVETLSPAANEKGLELVTEVPDGVMLFSDRRRMKQVLMNLAVNAVKFTDQGNVTIAARVPGDENLEVRVIDTGMGIKKEHMDKLFQPFPQIDVSLNKRHEGTGLGLHLTKKLVNLLGGDISAKSEYGRGSEFTFTIPLRYNKEGSKSEEDTGD